MKWNNDMLELPPNFASNLTWELYPSWTPVPDIWQHWLYGYVFYCNIDVYPEPTPD
jgi:hypothetical protein